MTFTPRGALRGVGIESVESGVDWITFVEKDPLGRLALVELGESLVRQEASAGAKVTGFHAEGYHGWKASRVSIGSRPDSSLLRISGGAAAMHWGSLRGFTGRPSRLDVQTSIKLTSERKDFGSLIMSRLKSHRRQATGRPLKVTIWRDSEGSFCGMVGSRTSRKYLRVYDKGVEGQTHAAGRFWRIELEAKRDLSGELWSQLKSTPAPSEWCLKCCESSARQSGLRWPLEPSSELPVLPPAPRPEPPEIERTKRWLRSMVAPAITRLVGAVDTGELLELLSLDGYAIPLNRAPRMERRA